MDKEHIVSKALECDNCRSEVDNGDLNECHRGD